MSACPQNARLVLFLLLMLGCFTDALVYRYLYIHSYQQAIYIYNIRSAHVCMYKYKQVGAFKTRAA